MWHNQLREAYGKVPQIYNRFADQNGGRCAIGVIVDGGQTNIGESTFAYKLYNLDDVVITLTCTNCPYRADKLSSFIMHLNDAHWYTFKDIADVIQPIEEEFRLDSLKGPEEPTRDLVYANIGNH